MSFKIMLIVPGLFLLSMGNCLALSEDEYLKYIEAEASKLAEPARPVVEDAVVEEKSASELSQSDFERLLEKKQKGTYSFYESLLEKDKAEVYKAYASGASWKKVRRMIIDRKLHR